MYGDLSSVVLRKWVESLHVLDGRVLADVRFKFHQMHLDWERTVRKQPGQVGFRLDFLWHEVQDDDAQRPHVPGIYLSVTHDEDILFFEELDGRQPLGKS